MTKLLHQKLTGQIIGVYYDVYNGTGRTYPEFIYERAMMNDLQRKRISCSRQPEYKIIYKDKLVGLQKIDLFVAGEVVVEIKVAPQLTQLHKAQAISYLKTVGQEVGLLCNFGGAEPEFERFFFNMQVEQSDKDSKPGPEVDWPSEFLAPDLTYNIIGGLFEVHSLLGPGFIHRIYANAVYHELSLRGLDAIPRSEYQILYRGRSVGKIKFNHLQIANSVMVFPVAIQDINDMSLNNLKAWMEVKNIPLGILANFYPSSLEYRVLRI